MHEYLGTHFAFASRYLKQGESRGIACGSSTTTEMYPHRASPLLAVGVANPPTMCTCMRRRNTCKEVSLYLLLDGSEADRKHHVRCEISAKDFVIEC